MGHTPSTRLKGRVRRLQERVVFLLAVCTCLGWADTLDGIRAAGATVAAIRAEFVQEKHLPILAQPLVSTGHLYYRRPDALRWEYTAPLHSVLLMRDGDVRRFVHSDRGWEADAGVRRQAMQVVMPEISSWLEGRFADSPLFTVALAGRGKILLTPRDTGLARFVQRIELRLGDRPGTLDEVVIREGEHAFTRMRFSDIQINPALPDRLFEDVP